jgi:hypothetical protein
MHGSNSPDKNGVASDSLCKSTTLSVFILMVSLSTLREYISSCRCHTLIEIIVIIYGVVLAVAYMARPNLGWSKLDDLKDRSFLDFDKSSATVAGMRSRTKQESISTVFSNEFVLRGAYEPSMYSPNEFLLSYSTGQFHQEKAGISESKDLESNFIEVPISPPKSALLHPHRDPPLPVASPTTPSSIQSEESMYGEHAPPLTPVPATPLSAVPSHILSPVRSFQQMRAKSKVPGSPFMVPAPASRSPSPTSSSLSEESDYVPRNAIEHPILRSPSRNSEDSPSGKISTPSRHATRPSLSGREYLHPRRPSDIRIIIAPASDN